MNTDPIQVTDEMRDRFPQFAGEHTVEWGDIRSALAGESDQERAEAVGVLDRLEAEGRLVRLMALTDQLGALLASMTSGAQAAGALWHQIVAEIEQATEEEPDAVWSEVHLRYVDTVTTKALALAGLIANEVVG